MLAPVPLPSLPMIMAWGDGTSQDQDLNQDVPIVETVPRSVPLSVYIRYPAEGLLERIVSMKTELAAVETLRVMKELTGYIETVDDFLGEFYSARGVAKPLIDYIGAEKAKEGIDTIPERFNNSEFQALLKSFVEPKMEFLTHVKQSAEAMAQGVGRMFGMKEFWHNGRYNDTFLDSFCLLIHKCRAVEQLAALKKGFINDLSFFMKYLQDSIEFISQSAVMRSWLFNSEAFTQGIIQEMMPKDQVRPGLDFGLSRQVFHILFKFIRQRLEQSDFIYPEMQYSYVDALVWLVKFYKAQRVREKLEFKKNIGWDKPVLNTFDKVSDKKSWKKQEKKVKQDWESKTKKLKQLLKERVMVELKDEDIAFIRAVFAVFPNVPEYMEFTEIVENNMWKKVMKKDLKAKLKREPHVTIPSMEEQLAVLRRNFRDLSHTVSEIATTAHKTVEQGKRAVELIPVVLRNVGNGLNRIREKLSLRLLHPPQVDVEAEISNFEKSMRVGLKDELNSFLVLLMMCRSVKELLQLNMPDLTECMTMYIQNYIQEFVWGVLPQTAARNDQQKGLVDTCEKLRALMACISEEKMKELSEAKKPGKVRPEKCPACPPHGGLLELIRAQLAYLVNPESEFVAKKGVFSKAALHETDQKEFRKFLDDTRFFADMLRLSDAIDEVCDQSNLFFKEYYLEAENVSFFPVTASLPVILSEYALLNYERPELTGAIFYPMSIYDDAASTALRRLKSRYLYEEIKAEARICLTSITRKISDSTFHPIRRYATLRTLSSSLMVGVARELGAEAIQEGVSAIRLGVLLQQNQLYLLGCHIDTKSLISERLNDIMNDEIVNIVSLTDRHGALASIAVDRLLVLIERTHDLLIGLGLPIMPFQDIVDHALCMDTPDSFQSLLLISVNQHLTTTALTDYCLLTNPNRLIPKQPVQVDIKGLFHGSIGVVMEALLRPTFAFITTESFRELFWWLDCGAITVLHSQLIGKIADTFDAFLERYRQVSDRLIRIKDAPISMSCFQVFDRFEGAYRYFLEDKDVLDLFEIMAQIGNIFALSEMMDAAFLMKRQSEAQNGAFFLNHRPDQTEYPERADIFTLFDKRWADTEPFISQITALPDESEVLAPFTYRAVEEIAHRILNAGDTFDECSNDLMDMPSLKGFAAKWSVLDFLFCLIETGKKVESRNLEDQGSMVQFGEGVQFCAAVILAVVGQKNLYRAVSIGEKIATHFVTDFSGASGERVRRYVDVYKMVSSTYWCSLSAMEPVVNMIVKTS